MKFLTPDTLHYRNERIAELQGLSQFAKSMPDTQMAESICEKIAQNIENIKSQYAEIEQEDGSILVKHPAIGYVEIEETLLKEPEHLFAAKTKSLSSNRVRLYRCDAKILVTGNVEYVNRELIMDVEMTQSAFSSVIANPGSGEYPMTIRNLNGESVQQADDLSCVRAKLMFDQATEGLASGIEQWVGELIANLDQSQAKPGAMTKADRKALSHSARVMSDWVGSNPGYYAKRLAEFTDSTASDIKLEIMSAHRIKGAN